MISVYEPKSDTIDLVALLIKYNFAKDERSAKGQIDGGNVEVVYYAFPYGTKIIKDEDKLSRATNNFNRHSYTIDKGYYICPAPALRGRLLVVGKKSILVDNNILGE